MEKSPYPFSPPSPHPPPPPPPPQKTSLPMLYYGLVVVGTAAIVLAIYNLIIIKWCANHQRRLHNMNRSLEGTSSLGIRRRSLDNSSINLGASFKYKKEGEGEGEGEGSLQLGYECPVCLSVFEEEEEVRQLPRCKHFFHAPCIDMWLYSHLDCPLCRAPVELREVFPRQTSVATPSDHSREVLLIEQGILV